MLRYSAKGWQTYDMYEDWSMAQSSLRVISDRAGYNHRQRVALEGSLELKIWILLGFPAEEPTILWMWLIYDYIRYYTSLLHISTPQISGTSIYNNQYKILLFNSIYGRRSSKPYLKYSKILQKRSLVHGCRSCFLVPTLIVDSPLCVSHCCITYLLT